MKKQQLNEWVHQLVNESNVEVVKEIQLGEATVRLSKSTDANFHKQGGGMIVQLVSNVGSVGLDVKDVRALLGYIKKMMGYSYMPRLKEDYNNSEWEVYTKDEKGNEKVVKVAKSKRAATILYNKIIKSDDYWEVGMRVKGYNEGITKEDIELGKVYTDKDRPPFQTNEQKLNERVVALPSGVKADLDTLKGLTIFTLKGKPIKFDRQQVAMLIRSVTKFMGIR